MPPIHVVLDHLPGVYTGEILLNATPVLHLFQTRSPVFTLVSFGLSARDLVTCPPTLLIFRPQPKYYLPTHTSECLH